MRSSPVSYKRGLGLFSTITLPSRCVDLLIGDDGWQVIGNLLKYCNELCRMDGMVVIAATEFCDFLHEALIRSVRNGYRIEGRVVLI